MFSTIALGLKNPGDMTIYGGMRGTEPYHWGAIFVDVVSGVALIVLGSLVASGVISLGGVGAVATHAMVGVGSLQVAVLCSLAVILLALAKNKCCS